MVICAGGARDRRCRGFHDHPPMDMSHPSVETRLAAALGDGASRIPVLLGPCGSGRTQALHRLGDSLPSGTAQYIDVERVISTPERFLEHVTRDSPFAWRPADAMPDGPRDAYRQALSYFAHARTASGGPATFLLDEAFEIRLFEHFPRLSGAAAETLAEFASSRNRFVLATKYEARALRLLRGASSRYLVVHVPPVTTASVAADLLRVRSARPDWAEDAARVVVALADGRAAYVAALVRQLSDAPDDARDPIPAFTRLLGPGGGIAARCRCSYEVRLHRARGYGALKAVLEILADDEPLTLTEVSLRLRRSPGSTRDYLGWLEDVDLVRVQRKRFTVADPVLRVWLRLRAEGDAAADDDERSADIVRRYALARVSAGVTAEG